MKKLIFLILLFSNKVFTQNTSVSITIANIKSQQGNLYIAWFTDNKSFETHTNATYQKVINVENQDLVIATFPDIKPGKYAIAVFLDKNGNKKLDTNLLGIPKERYGFVADLLPRFRAPRFEEICFELTPNTDTLYIKLK